MSKTLTTTLDDELAEELEEIADERDWSLSKVISNLIKVGLENWK